MKNDINEAFKILEQKKFAIEKGLKIGGEKIRNEIILSMTRTPRDYTKSYYTNNSKIPHHPSKPFNPPARDTGALISSIHYSVEVKEKSITLTVGSFIEGNYPKWLETGTSRMKPRPWLKPAVEKNLDFIADTIRGFMNDKR